MTKILGALALTLLLVACGSGSSSSSYGSARAVADAAGCTGFHGQSPEAFAADAGACRFHGHPTYVQWFKDGSSLDRWWQVAAASGTALLRGSDWAIECDRQPDCDELAARLGGTQG